MSHSNKKYKIGQIKQLIDLNGDTTNFDISFTVSCKTGEIHHLVF